MAIMKASFPKKYIFNELAGNVEKKNLWDCTLSKIEIRNKFTFTPHWKISCLSCNIEDCKAVPKDEHWTPFD
jgi:hypothetical protein